MKKLFSFRSSMPSIITSDRVPPPELTDNEKIYWETINNAGKSVKQLAEGQNSAPYSALRRSLSFSSATLNDSTRSPSGSNTAPDFPVDCRSLTPERQFKSKRRERTKSSTRKGFEVERFDSPISSKGCHNSIGNSSWGSPPHVGPLKLDSSRLIHVPNKVLDLYIDGEQQQEDRNLRTKNGSLRNTSSNVVDSGWRPPRVQSTAPSSPAGSKERFRSHSFRDMRDNQLSTATREWKRNDLRPESPQKIAKNVVERLSRVKPKSKSRDFDLDTPTTVEDSFEDFMDSNPGSNSDYTTQKSCLSDRPYRTSNENSGEKIPDFLSESLFPGYAPVGKYSGQTEEEIDMELHKKALEAQERVMLISDELELDNFLQDNSFSIAELFQTIRSLTEERRSLAHEVSAHIHNHISERETAREALRVAKVELEARTRKLEKEKNELQLGLEKELDKRSSDWSFKLGKYQSEEQRLRERVRELAEQNVSLQREVSSLSGREEESKSRMANSELQLKDVSKKLEKLTDENKDLQQTLSDLQERHRVAESDKDCIQRSYKEKEKESKELRKTLSRLQRTCNGQEKTIAGLRQGLSEETGMKEPFDKDVRKWQVEQVRLSGVEQNLRKEVESYRLEVESLRHENINLLDRLRSSGTEGGYSLFKLDQELQDRVYCLQNQGLTLFGESSDLCDKLLRFFKGESNTKGNRHVQEVGKRELDGYFLMESNMKVQSFRRAIENLRRNLQTMSSVLREKSKLAALESHSACTEDRGSRELKDLTLEDDTEVKLEAETLLTSLLREKLYSNQMEIEQLQTELATAARGHDILRSEVQGAMDSLSSASHRMKELELQMLRKEDNINQLKSDLQDCKKDLAIKNGILPKISEERDLMWEEVKQYSEKNMLIVSEVNFLKKKIDTLDEDIHLKEGQITILKDSLGSKPYIMLYSPNSLHEEEFRLE